MAGPNDPSGPRERVKLWIHTHGTQADNDGTDASGMMAGMQQPQRKRLLRYTGSASDSLLAGTGHRSSQLAFAEEDWDLQPEPEQDDGGGEFGAAGSGGVGVGVAGGAPQGSSMGQQPRAALQYRGSKHGSWAPGGLMDQRNMSMNYSNSVFSQSLTGALEKLGISGKSQPNASARAAASSTVSSVTGSSSSSAVVGSSGGDGGGHAGAGGLGGRGESGSGKLSAAECLDLKLQAQVAAAQKRLQRTQHLEQQQASAALLLLEQQAQVGIDSTAAAAVGSQRQRRHSDDSGHGGGGSSAVGAMSLSDVFAFPGASTLADALSFPGSSGRGRSRGGGGRGGAGATKAISKSRMPVMRMRSLDGT